MVKKNRAVSKEKVTVIAGALRQKAKTPNTLTLEQMVKELGKEIQEMLDAGYGYEEVAALFAEHEVEIAASSIKSYHRKSRTPAAVAEAASTAPEPNPPQVDALPAAEVSTPTRSARKGKGERQGTERRTKQDASTVHPESAFNVTDRNAL